jgi:hypothetical protein
LNMRLVSRCGRTRSREVRAAVGALRAARVRLLGTVLNMVPEDHGLLRRPSPVQGYNAPYAAGRDPDSGGRSALPGQPTAPPPHGELAVALPPTGRFSAPAGHAPRNDINGAADGTNGAYVGDLAEAGRHPGPARPGRPVRTMTPGTTSRRAELVPQTHARSLLLTVCLVRCPVGSIPRTIS